MDPDVAVEICDLLRELVKEQQRTNELLEEAGRNR